MSKLENINYSLTANSIMEIQWVRIFCIRRKNSILCTILLEKFRFQHQQSVMRPKGQFNLVWRPYQSWSGQSCACLRIILLCECIQKKNYSSFLTSRKYRIRSRYSPILQSIPSISGTAARHSSVGRQKKILEIKLLIYEIKIRNNSSLLLFIIFSYPPWRQQFVEHKL